MMYTAAKNFTFDECLDRYGDNPRYELIDGELRDMDLTGPHETVAGNIVWGRKLTRQFFQVYNFDWMMFCLDKI
jgi:hypothetical protein